MNREQFLIVCDLFPGVFEFVDYWVGINRVDAKSFRTVPVNNKSELVHMVGEFEDSSGQKYNRSLTRPIEKGLAEKMIETIKETEILFV